MYLLNSQLPCISAERSVGVLWQLLPNISRRSREASNGKNIRSKKVDTKRLRDKIYTTRENHRDPRPLIQFRLTSIILNSTAKFVTTAKSTQGATANCQ
jgi:hypothetical protein